MVPINQRLLATMDSYSDYDELYFSDSSDHSGLTNLSFNEFHHDSFAGHVFRELKEYKLYQRPDILCYLSVGSLADFIGSLDYARAPTFSFYPEAVQVNINTITETKVCKDRWVEITGRELNDIYYIFQKYGIKVSNDDFETFVLRNSKTHGYLRV
jgi:hypothetical protein